MVYPTFPTETMHVTWFLIIYKNQMLYNKLMKLQDILCQKITSEITKFIQQLFILLYLTLKDICIIVEHGAPHWV